MSMSIASGRIEITIVTEKEKDFLKAWELIADALNGKAYPTWMEYRPDFPWYLPFDGYCRGSSEFHALCDESYANNISHFGEWLEDSILDDDDRRFLEKLGFRIEYTYADYREGNEYMNCAIMSNTHEAHTPLSDTDARAIRRKHIEATEEHLKEYGLEDC